MDAIDEDSIYMCIYIYIYVGGREGKEDTSYKDRRTDKESRSTTRVDRDEVYFLFFFD